MCAFGFGRATADFSTPTGRVHRGRALLAHHADAALQFSFLTPPQHLNLKNYHSSNHTWSIRLKLPGLLSSGDSCDDDALLCS